MKFICTDSLVKIFPETKTVRRFRKATALLQDEFYLQLFMLGNELKRDVEIVCSMPNAVTYYVEDFIAALNTTLPGADDYTVGKTGLYPDLLRPLSATDFFLRPNIASAAFVCIDCKKLGAGKHTLEFVLRCKEEVLACAVFSLYVVNDEYIENDLIVTNWLHSDCIADYYGYKPWTDAHFESVFHFMSRAVANGINTVLVPCFTPPLDTQVGSERTCVQLIGVEETEAGYEFDFSLLDRFVTLAEKAGVCYLEISHLYSQWGAQFCPNIYVCKNGKKYLKFGWHTDSEGEDYRTFLKTFLPLLNERLKFLGFDGRVIYHISDEPNGQHLERYKRHLSFLKEILPDSCVMDALSEFKFHGIGIDLPVVSIDASDPFFAAKVPVMVYYCTGQDRHYEPNSFFCTPSERNRVLGIMLYKSGARGFLHWGYNFYNSYLSIRQIDPFYETDSAGRYQAGDAFLVYPGKDGRPLDSLRLKVFSDAFRDYRALKLLEQKRGREFVISMLEEKGFIGYFDYPHNAKALLDLRDKINIEIGRSDN